MNMQLYLMELTPEESRLDKMRSVLSQAFRPLTYWKAEGLVSVAKWGRERTVFRDSVNPLVQGRIESGENVLFPPLSNVTEDNP